MKSSNVPHLAPPKKAEAKAEARSEAKHRSPGPKPEPKPALAAAGESTDPAVHSLIAKRYHAELSGDVNAANAASAALAELGYK